MRSPRGDQDEFIPDETSRPYRGDDVLLQFDTILDSEPQPSAVVRQTDRFNLAYLDARNFDRVAELEASNGGEIGVNHVAPVPEQLQFSQSDRQVGQANDADEDEDADEDFRAGVWGRRSSFF